MKRWAEQALGNKAWLKELKGTNIVAIAFGAGTAIE